LQARITNSLKSGIFHNSAWMGKSEVLRQPDFVRPARLNLFNKIHAEKPYLSANLDSSGGEQHAQQPKQRKKTIPNKEEWDCR
jgi:hypothetical protein